MNKTTIEEFTERIRVYDVVNDDGSISCCPNGIIKCKGKPDIVWAFYNNRKYYWELVE